MEEHPDRDAEETTPDQSPTHRCEHYNGQNKDRGQQGVQHEGIAEAELDQREDGSEGHQPIVDHRTLKDLRNEERSDDEEPDQHGLSDQQAAALFAGNDRILRHFADLVDGDGRKLHMATIATAANEAGNRYPTELVAKALIPSE